MDKLISHKPYRPDLIAAEIVGVFAKYNMPIHMKDMVYKYVDELINFQTVVTPDYDALGIKFDKTLADNIIKNLPSQILQELQI